MTQNNGLPEAVYNIHGFLSPGEMALLYKLAAEVSPNGRIVEIGSFQGKSTVCLGLGAKQAGAQVWAIDPHEDFQINDETHYGMENHVALLKNLVDFEVSNTVRVVALHSMQVLRVNSKFQPIDLLWIDGSHEYDDVMADLTYRLFLAPDGKMVLHDTSGHFPGVTRALNELLTSNEWQILEQVDATTVLGRES